MKDFFGHRIEVGDTVVWAINSVLVEGTVVSKDGSRIVVEDSVGNQKIKMTYDTVVKVEPEVHLKQSVGHNTGEIVGIRIG